MNIVRQLSSLRNLKQPVCLAAGFFDGVHLGHQEVLGKTIKAARRIGGEAWAMTFDPHPLKVLTPHAAPRLLTDTTHKLQLLEQFGLDGCLLIPFNRHFSTLSAEEFLALLGHGIPTLHSLYMGHDWRFGHKGQGDFTLLRNWSSGKGISVHQVPSVLNKRRPISSTRIRNAIGKGDLDEAASLLGRPFSVLGTVVTGQQIGRTLGFPTANLAPRNEAAPPTGIYSVQAIIGTKAYPGVVNFGHHPTISRIPKPILELHLLDTRMNLYHRKIEVFFLRRLRPEKKFATRPALIRQINGDIEATRTALASTALKKLWIRTLQRWHPESIVRQTNK